MPYAEMIGKDLSLHTGFMYEPDTPRKVFRMLEAGLIDVSEERGFKYETMEGLGALEDDQTGMARRLHLRFRLGHSDYQQ